MASDQHLIVINEGAGIGLSRGKGAALLRITRDFSLDKLERGLEAIAAGEGTLQLPHWITANAAGTETALLQLIITWARGAANDATLRLYSKFDDEEGQRAFAQTAFGLTALNMASAVEDQSGQQLDRYLLLTLARDYVIAMAEKPIAALREFNKASLSFLCVDNARNYRRPARLYVPSTDRVRDRSDFASLVKACASQLPGTQRLGGREILEAAASLLVEAFQNTHDHAQTDFRGDVLRRSVRGVIISFRFVRLEALGHAGGASALLQGYYAGWKPSVPTAKHAQFLELGIFDSGPGLARRWLSYNESLAQSIPGGNHLSDEYDAVVGCLEKGASTKSGSTSGNGLYRIMQVVKRTGGFIRIRTGNLSLVKPFDDSGASLAPDDLRLLDLMTGTQTLERRAWSEGTTISVLLPTNRAIAQ